VSPPGAVSPIGRIFFGGGKGWEVEILLLAKSRARTHLAYAERICRLRVDQHACLQLFCWWTKFYQLFYQRGKDSC